MTAIKAFLNRSLVWNVLFWIGILIYLTSTANMNFYQDYWQVLEFNSMVLFTQIVAAVVLMNVLIPKYLDRKKYIQFFLLLLLLMVFLFVVYTLFKLLHYDPKYQHTFNETGKRYAKESLLERLSYPSVFLSKIIKFLTPTALLLIVQFYKSQRQLSELKEQKRTAELSALKNQLNPHFLFNTLNNLYSLAIEKSEKTPEVIERLSNILDHILYRSKDDYISLERELNLIDDYLALEKVRYGDRVRVYFHKHINNDCKIAPLILLTFIENAFKHGVKQELEQAEISITITTKEENIIFEIVNTKPLKTKEPTTEALGLKNVQKQLELLYPDKYDLNISETDHHYTVVLTLKVDYHV